MVESQVLPLTELASQFSWPGYESRYPNARTGSLSLAVPRWAAVETFDVPVLSQPATKKTSRLKKPAIRAGFFSFLDGRVRVSERTNKIAVKDACRLPSSHCGELGLGILRCGGSLQFVGFGLLSISSLPFLFLAFVVA